MNPEHQEQKRRAEGASYDPNSVQAMFATLLTENKGQTTMLHQFIKAHELHIKEDAEIHKAQDEKIFKLYGTVRWIIGIGSGIAFLLGYIELVLKIAPAH